MDNSQIGFESFNIYGKRPSISVIIPVYNRQRYLAKCLDSIVDQTIFSELDVIIVDDGSTDESRTISKKYLHSYSNIRLVEQKNSGVGKARNVGLDCAEGIWVSFVDSDDYVKSDYFEQLLSYANEDINLVQSSGIDINENGSVIAKSLGENKVQRVYLSPDFNPECKDYEHSTVWGCLFRREKIQDLRFDNKLSIGEDTLFFYSYISKNGGYVHIPYRGYYYVIHDNTLAHGAGRAIDEVHAWLQVSSLLPLRPSRIARGIAANHLSRAVLSNNLSLKSDRDAARSLSAKLFFDGVRYSIVCKHPVVFVRLILAIIKIAIC